MTAEQVTAQDLCLYAMHLLDAAETARLDDFLSQSTEARAELERIRGDLALLAFTAPSKPTSPGLRQRVLREIAREPENVPAAALKGGAHTIDPQPLAAQFDELLSEDSYTPSTPQTSRSEEIPDTISPRGNSLRAWMWAGWTFAAGLAVSSALLYTRAHGLQVGLRTAEAKASHAADDQRQATVRADNIDAISDALRPGASQHFVLTAQGVASSPVAHVTYSPERGALVVQASNLQPLATGKTYALWLFLVQKESPPEMLGTFLPDAHGFASLAVSSLPPGVLADHVAITVEEEGMVRAGPSTSVLTAPQ